MLPSHHPREKKRVAIAPPSSSVRRSDRKRSNSSVVLKDLSHSGESGDTDDGIEYWNDREMKRNKAVDDSAVFAAGLQALGEVRATNPVVTFFAELLLDSP